MNYFLKNIAKKKYDFIDLNLFKNFLIFTCFKKFNLDLYNYILCIFNSYIKYCLVILKKITLSII